MIINILGCTPVLSLSWLIVNVLTCFSISLGPLLYPSTPPPLSLGSANAWKGKVLKVEVQRRRRGQKGCREGKDKEQKVRALLSSHGR